MVTRSPTRQRHWIVLGALLLLAGLCGHLLAARAIGGYYIAYRDHILGWALLTAISALIVAPLGWRFWKGKPGISLFVVGALQAILGLLIYLQRFNIH